MSISTSTKRLVAAALCCAASSALWAANDSGWLSAIDLGKAPQQQSAAPQVSAKLIAENKALTPQALNRLAVVLEHRDGWHTYWRMPGDAGLPSQFQFTTPSGFKASAPQFPLPERIVTGSLMSFGYGAEALFPFTLDIPRQNRFGNKVTVSVKIEFLACKDLCVPGEATAQITLPLAVAAQPSDDAPRIAQALTLVPEVVKDVASAEIEGTNLRIDVPATAGVVKSKLDFYPLEGDAFKLNVLPQYVAQENDASSLYLTASDAFAQSPRETLTGVLVADGGPAEGGWAVETTVPLEAGTVTPPERAAEPVVVELPSADAGSITTWTAIAFAFLGGLILNLMPCVFPVLSLKLLQLLEGAKKGEGLLGHGLAFTGGVLLTMGALSGVLMALRGAGMALGWGFQLQSPVVVALLILLFVAITLNLLGLFEFTLGSGVADAKVVRGAPKSGAANSFLTGVLAVIVASPCTAPFMGAALGYALTQPAIEAVGIFLALGAGMALPWLLLCVFPSWAKLLPKPGPWMETFRRVMAVPMALALVWLGWVLSKQIDYRGMLVLACGLGATAVFFWLLGREQWGRGRNRPLMAAMGAISLIAVGVCGNDAFVKQSETIDVEAGWSAWSDEAVRAGLAAGRPVFVDFTAAWCVTCQANKAAALHRDEVARKMEELNVVKLTADWTNRNEEISRVLGEFGRSGVPLYLLYSPSGKVTVLPELLTPSIVIDALEENAR